MRYISNYIIAKFICIIFICLFSINARADSFPACLIENPCDCECDDINESWPTTVKIFHGLNYPSQAYPAGSPPPGAKGAPSPSDGTVYSAIQPPPGDLTNPPIQIPFSVNNSYTGNCICPPYNKTSRSSCLQQHSTPPMFDIAYLNICAEESPVSNYFVPKIRYRSQVCNIACWTQSGDLSGAGDCDYIASPYGLPVIRVCARVAVPADPVVPSAADEGYTVDVHLDFEGYVVDDKPLSNGGYDANGNPLGTPDPLLQVPKVCLYHDPSLIDTLIYPDLALIGPLYTFPYIELASINPFIKVIDDAANAISAQVANATGTSIPSLSIPTSTNEWAEFAVIEATILTPDFLDYNPIQEANQHAAGISPIFQFIITIVKDIELLPLIENMLNAMPSYLQFAVQPLKLLAFLSEFVTFAAETGLIALLEYIGTLNRVVVGSFGCVLMPLGPFPPPYCTHLIPNLEIPVTYPICTTSVLSDAITVLSQMSTATNPCSAGLCKNNLISTYIQNPNYSNITKMPSVSTIPIPFGLCITPNKKVRNNAINNSIRVGFNDYRPICPPATIRTPDPTSTGSCVYIEGVLSASLLHLGSNNKDTIEVCGTSPAGMGETPCIQSTYLQNQCSSSSPPWYCANGARISYTIGLPSQNMGTDFFDVALPDCSGASTKCQSVWGVNLGAYADLSVAFPTTEITVPSTTSPPGATSPNQATLLSTPVPLPDLGGSIHYFQAAVTRIPVSVGNGMTAQEPFQICAYESSDSTGSSPVTVGCENRAPAPKPSVYDCSLSGLCTSTYFAPAMVSNLAVPYKINSAYTGVGDEVNAPWLVDTTQGPVYVPVANSTNNTTINLAGYNYNAYGTTGQDSQDYSYLKIPYTDPHAFLNSATRYGNYTDGGAPYDGTGSPVSPMPQYIDGIEYLNHNYQIGATFVCLTGYQFDDCLTGQTRKNCVLANFLNNTIIPCTTFAGIMAQNGGMNVCPTSSNFLTCDKKHPLATFNGSGSNVLSVLSCKGTGAGNGGPVISTHCYSYTAPKGVDTTQALCSPSTNSSDRQVPLPSAGDVLVEDIVPNVDYYAYDPNISSSSTAQSALSTQTNVSASGTVSAAAQTEYTELVAPSYTTTVCVSDQTLVSDNTSTQYQQIMAACNQTRGALANQQSICKFATGVGVAAACSTANSAISRALSNQYGSESVAQIQTDATTAQTALATLQATIYTPSICFQNQNLVSSPSSPSYTQLMNACTNARTVQANVASVCASAQAAAANPSGIYSLISATCAVIQNNITAIVTDQYDAQLVSQIQSYGSQARTQLSNLMAVINNFSSSDSLLLNIMSIANTIATSTDLTTYPNPGSQISAICSQALSTISTATTVNGITTYADNFTASAIFAATQKACNIAIAAPQNAATLTTLNNTIQGLSQYLINPPAKTSGQQLAVNGAVVSAGYVEPNFNTMIVRNRTDMENGLCIGVALPKCHVISDGSKADGFASWPKSDIGTQATGTCNSGYIQDPAGPPTRYCYVNSPNQSSGVHGTTTWGTSVTNSCLAPSLGNIKIAQNLDPNVNSGKLPYSTPNGKILYNTNTNNAIPGTVSCNSNPCISTNTITFDLVDPQAIGMVLNFVAISDYMTMEINGVLFQLRSGNNSQNYPGSENHNGAKPWTVWNAVPSGFNNSNQYTFLNGNGKAPWDLTHAGLNRIAAWGNSDGYEQYYKIDTDISAYLQSGTNTIIVRWWFWDNGYLAYEIDYTISQ